MTNNEQYDIFISYSHEDKYENMKIIKQQLEKEGLKVWLDKDSIHDQERWKKKIREDINNSKLFLAVISENYLNSKWCKTEWTEHKRREIMTGLRGQSTVYLYYKDIPGVDDTDCGDETYKKIVKEFRELQHPDPWFAVNDTKLDENTIYKRIEKDGLVQIYSRKKDEIEQASKSVTNMQSLFEQHLKNVVDRAEQLDKVRESFEGNSKVTLLTGKHDVGKTALSCMYASAYATDYPAGRFYVDCVGLKDIPETAAKFVDRYPWICKEVGSGSSAKTKQEDLFYRLRNAMLWDNDSNSKGKCIVILDNVEMPEKMFNTDAISKYLDYGNLHILAIAKNEEIKNIDDCINLLPVAGELKDEEAISLLRSYRYFGDSDSEEVEAIKKIIDRVKYSVSLLKLIGRYAEKNEKCYKDVSKLIDENVSVDEKFGIFFEEIKEDCGNLVNYAALLHPKYVYTEWLKELPDSEGKWSDTEKQLQQWHTISEDKSRENSARMRISKKFAGYLRKNMDDKLERIKKLISAIDTCLKKKEKAMPEEILAVILAALIWVEDGAYCDDVIEFVLSEEFYKKVESTSKFRDYMRLMGKIVKISGISDKYKFKSKQYLAQCYYRFGNYEGASEIWNEIMASSDIDAEVALFAKRKLADCYYARGMYRDALELREKVYKAYIEKKKCPIGVISALAHSYSSVGNYKEALKFRKVALKLLRKDSKNYLWALSDLALSYEENGMYPRAKKYREEVLRSFSNLRVDGNMTADEVSAMSALAISYRELGEYEIALKLREEIFDWRKENLGDKHPATLITEGRLAASYSETGNIKKARELRQEVLDKRKEIFWDKHPDVLRAELALASSCSEHGEKDKALKLRQEVLDVRKELYGEENPDVINTKLALSISYFELEDYEKALKLCKEVLEARKRLYDKLHPDVLTARWALADMYRQIGYLGQAKEEYDDLIGIVTKKLGQKHPKTKEIEQGLDKVYEDMGLNKLSRTFNKFAN